MTVKQIAEITGKSEQAIRMAIKKICPEIDVLQGKLIDLTEFQTLRILKHYQSSFQIEQPQRNVEAPQRNIEAPRQNTEYMQAIAKLIQQLRLAKKPAAIDLVLSKYLGLGSGVPTNTSQPPPLLLPHPISKEEAAARAYARNIINKRKRKDEDVQDQRKFDWHEYLTRGNKEN